MSGNAPPKKKTDAVTVDCTLRLVRPFKVAVRVIVVQCLLLLS